MEKVEASIDGKPIEAEIVKESRSPHMIEISDESIDLTKKDPILVFFSGIGAGALLYTIYHLYPKYKKAQKYLF